MRIRPRTWVTDKGAPRRGFEVDLGIGDDGKRKRKLFKTRAEAKDWLSDNAASPGEAAGETTIEQAGWSWIASVKADGRERSTWTKYESHLEHHIAPARISLPCARARDTVRFGDLRAGAVTPPIVLRLKTVLQESLSPAMVAKVMGSVRMLLRQAVREGTIATNPAAEIRAKRGERRKKKVEIPTVDEMHDILGALQPGAGTLTLGQVWVPFEAMTGLRPSEMRGLYWHRLLLDRPQPIVRVDNRADEWNQMGPPKSEAGFRDVPLPASLVKLLKAWHVACPPSPGYKRPRLPDLGRPRSEPLQHQRPDLASAARGPRPGEAAEAHRRRPPAEIRALCPTALLRLGADSRAARHAEEGPAAHGPFLDPDDVRYLRSSLGGSR
jgi:integrase